MVRRDGNAISNLDYECMPPKNRSSRAAADMTDKITAGIRSSFLKICMIPVKSMSNKMMATGFLASKKYRLICAFVASTMTTIKPMIEQAHKAILRALMFSGVKEVIGVS